MTAIGRRGWLAGLMGTAGGLLVPAYPRGRIYSTPSPAVTGPLYASTFGSVLIYVNGRRFAESTMDRPIVYEHNGGAGMVDATMLSPCGCAVHHWEGTMFSGDTLTISG